LPPAEGTLGEWRSPDAPHRLNQGIHSHYIGHGEIEAGTSEPRQILHIGVTADEQPQTIAAAKDLFQRIGQFPPEIFAGRGLFDPVMELVEKLERLPPPGLAVERIEVAVPGPHPLPQFDEAGLPTPADIEFGFDDGRLVLFQIRPYLRNAAARRNHYLLTLDRQVVARGGLQVAMDEIPEAMQ
jgi:hypothetical protein